MKSVLASLGLPPLPQLVPGLNARMVLSPSPSPAPPQPSPKPSPPSPRAAPSPGPAPSPEKLQPPEGRAFTIP